MALTPVSTEKRIAEEGVGNDPNAKRILASVDQNALAKQILGTSDLKNWKGEGFGSPEANSQYIATLLDRAGITDLKQFGQLEDGSYGNKETGKAIDSGSGRWQNQGGAGLFGGTGMGEGNTGFRVRFDDQGNPQFYTTQGTSNDLAQLMKDMGPVFQIGMAIATGGLSIPQQIAANMAVQLAAGQDIGDAVKNAAVSLAVANVPGSDFMKETKSFIKDMGLDPSLTKTLTTATQNAASSATRAVLTGQNVFDAALKGAATGGINSVVNTITSNVDGFKDLTPNQQKMLVNTVTGIVSGKPLDQVVINSAIAAANAEIHGAKNLPSTTGVDKATVGNFDDTEVARLEKLGYTKDQIKEYFGRLENLTGALDEPQETLPVEDTPLSTRSLGSDPVKALEDAGLNETPIDDYFKPTTGIEELLVTGKSEKEPTAEIPTYSPIDDYFKPTKGIEELIVTGKSEKEPPAETPTYSPIDDYFKPTKGVEELVMVGEREPKYLPTDDDFPRTPIKDEGEMVVVGDRPTGGEHVFDPTFGGVLPMPTTPVAPSPTTPGSTAPSPTAPKPATPTAPKPATPTASSGMDMSGLIALLGGQQQPVQQAPMQDPYAHIKLMEDLFGSNLDLTPTGNRTA